MVSRMDDGPDQEAAAAQAGRLLALGSLVPGVVHELNNALLGLLGMLELAQADASPAVGERLAIAQRAGEEIRGIARVLGALARESLDESATAELRDLAGDASEAARTLNLARGLELVEVYAREAAPVDGVVAEVRQAILLLLAAGFASSGRDGPLVVEVGPDGTAGPERRAVPIPGSTTWPHGQGVVAASLSSSGRGSRSRSRASGKKFASRAEYQGMERFGQSWRRVTFVWPPSPPKPHGTERTAGAQRPVRIRRLLQR
jgi:signal transduction histidine kinase